LFGKGYAVNDVGRVRIHVELSNKKRPQSLRGGREMLWSC
jgi:hypothetical protein